MPEKQHGDEREQHGVDDDGIEAVERPKGDGQRVGARMGAQEVCCHGYAEKARDISEQDSRPYNQAPVHEPALTKRRELRQEAGVIRFDTG